MDIKESTPEFIRWTLQHPCSLRLFDDPDRPDLTERALRPLQVYSLADQENRLFEQIGFHTDVKLGMQPEIVPHGFCAEEILAPFGGYQTALEMCGACPANASSANTRPANTSSDQRPSKPGLAGCYGALINPTATPWSTLFQNAIVSNDLQVTCRQLFLKTEPMWFGLWSDKVLSNEQARFIAILIESISCETVTAQQQQQLIQFQRALQISAGSEIRIRCDLIPAGSRDRRFWYLPAHCPRCSSAREPKKKGDSNPAPPCPVCKTNLGPSAAKKRHAIGKRPYRPLKDFLGEEGASQWVARYLKTKS